MKKIWAIYLDCIVALLVGSSTNSYAADIYISQNAAGSATGADCADAFAVSWFNNSANWGGSVNQIGPGVVVHLCGIITTELAFQGSGSSNAPIELLFEAGAAVQINPGADANGGIGLGSNSNILIDGGANQPCGWNTAKNSSEGSCNGKIENMLYGSSDAVCPSGLCTIQAASGVGNLIQGSGSNIEIRNLEAGPSYVHTATGNSGNDTHGTGGIADTNGSNWNIHDCKLHDAGWYATFTVSAGTVSGITLKNNEIYNSASMIPLAGSGSAILNGVTIAGNYTHDMANWQTTSDTWHSEAIHFYGTGVTASNLLIYNNIFAGNTGQNITAELYAEQFARITNLVVFNNLFTASQGASIWVDQCNSGCYFYNNTMANSATNGTGFHAGNGSYVLDATIENNIMEQSFTLFYVDDTLASLSPLNYNAYGPNGGYPWVYNGSASTSLSAWQGASGEGVNSLYNSSSLGLAASFVPNLGAPVIGVGLNICASNPSFCNSYPAIMNDLAGNPRPTTGGWDIGAYQYGSSPANSVAPASPMSLRTIVVQ